MFFTASPYAAWGRAFALLAVLNAAGCLSVRDPGNVERGPASMVLITVDGLVPSELKLFGGETESRAFERLAGEGRAWSDVWTTCPMTRPAVATYLTGVAPDVHGVREDMFVALPADRPTLPEVLGAAGYHTAAFPDSSFLGAGSGLLRGFETIDDPEAMLLAPAYWLPVLKKASQVGADFTAWLDGVPSNEPFFAWLHFSGPLLQQVAGVIHETDGETEGDAQSAQAEVDQDEPVDGNGSEGGLPQPAVREGDPATPTETPLSRIDTALGKILDALEARGDWGRTAVIVAGTQADALGGETEPPGIGFSLSERAIRVALVARLPGGVGEARPAESHVWAPDVAATLAALGGVQLPAAEGIDLREAAPEERIVFAWSWAPRDQLGWRPLRAARSGSSKWVEGHADRLVQLPDEVETTNAAAAARLQAALSARANPAAPSVDAEHVRALLSDKGIEFAPVPPQGREFGPPERRRAVAGHLLVARRALYHERTRRAMNRLRAALEEDPDNFAALLSLGQMQSMSGRAEARVTMGRAVGLEPTNPEALHWYAHALWSDSWKEAESILQAILPLRPHDPDLLYDLACAASLSDDLPRSAELLAAAVRAGFTRWPHIESDPDLRNLRKSELFASVLREFSR